MRVRKVMNSFQNYKILLLDDDEKYVAKKVEVLKNYGYGVEGETSVEIALGKLRQGGYDLLILDYLMDEMRGDKVVEEIRKFDSDLYILLLTGYAEAPALEIMNTLDITAYCEKSNDNNQLLLLIKSALKSVEMMKKVKRHRDGLSKILQAVPNVYQIQPVNDILVSILSELLFIVSSNDAFIMVENISEPEIGLLHKTVFHGIGQFEAGIGSVNDELMLRIDHVRSVKRFDVLENGILVPLVSERFNSLGVLFIRFQGNNIDEEVIKVLKIFAAIATSSITNALLQSVIEQKNEELEQTREEIATWYLSTVDTIRLAIDAKDHYTAGHSERVSEYSVGIGKAMGLPAESIILLRDSGIFHDVGKIGIDDGILKKAGSISSEEYEEIKKHPQRGALILSAVSMFKDIVPIVLYHHERIDGTGYPSGLEGKDIPFLARILCVADALDAMTTNRTYRSKKTPDEAISELRKGAGTQFDADVVDVTVDLILKGLLLFDDTADSISAS